MVLKNTKLGQYIYIKSYGLKAPICPEGVLLNLQNSSRLALLGSVTSQSPNPTCPTSLVKSPSGSTKLNRRPRSKDPEEASQEE